MGNSQPKPLVVRESGFLYVHELANEKVGAKKTCLFLIDPQNDFVLPTGSLSVPGAEADCKRIASLVSNHLPDISEVFITLDTHQKLHIAHPMFWINAKNECPQHFTKITVEDVEKGVWKVENPQHESWALQYVRGLKKGGRFDLVIWPEHCLVGSTGHAVYEPLMNAIHEWELLKKSSPTFIMKGNNAFTEHYSALKAEVPMAGDPSTLLNTALIARLKEYDTVIIAGEALSHCVNFTVRDLVANWPKSERRRLRIVSDGCSSVTGFESAGEAFVADMKKLGITFVTAENAFQ